MGCKVEEKDVENIKKLNFGTKFAEKKDLYYVLEQLKGHSHSSCLVIYADVFYHSSGERRTFSHSALIKYVVEWRWPRKLAMEVLS